MMFRSFAIVLFWASAVSAQDDAALFDDAVTVDTAVLIVAPGKFFLLDISTDPPTVSRLSHVLRVGGTAPNPNPNPTPAPTKPLAEVIRENTNAVDEPMIAKAMAEGIYVTLRDRLNAGTMTWDQCKAKISEATTMVIGQSDKPAAWTAWKDKLYAIIDRMESEGKFKTKVQQLAFLDAVNQGLSSSSANAAIDFEKLIRLIRLILDLINSFKFAVDGEQPAEPVKPNIESPIQRDGASVQPGKFEVFGRLLMEKAERDAQKPVERKQPVVAPAPAIKFNKEDAFFGLAP